MENRCSRLLINIKNFWRTHVNFSVSRDPHFNEVLMNFYKFGFFCKSRSKKRVALSVVLFVIIFLSFSLKCWKNLADAISSGNRKVFALSFLPLRSLVVISELTSFVVNQSLIANIVESFFIQSSVVKASFDKLCSRAIKAYKIFGVALTVTVFSVNLVARGKIHHILPTLYEDFSSGYFMFCVNAVHFCIFLTLVLTVDLLPALCILKLEMLIKVLCDQVKEATEGSDEENDTKLKKCIEFHTRIIK